MPYKYLPKPIDKLKNNYNERVRSNQNSFESFEDFLDWYNAQEKSCHYCKLTEAECQEIVMTGMLTSNRFPQNGIIGRGRARGVWLEVDRFLPKENYSRNNCALCCYFCNNDKSDVFTKDEYLKFQENRLAFLKKKLQK